LFYGVAGPYIQTAIKMVKRGQKVKNWPLPMHLSPRGAIERMLRQPRKAHVALAAIASPDAL
jgi:hypothetical protein